MKIKNFIAEKFSNSLKAVNYIVILIASVVIATFGAIYFLGYKETYQEIKNHIPISFFMRLFACAFFSFSFSVFLLFINLIIQIIIRTDKTFPFKIALHSIVITMTTSFIGLLIFFIL